MQINFRIVTAYLCLCFYLLFGLLNTGGISFCLGDEHSRHIGVDFFGYESCYESEHLVVNTINTTLDKSLPSVITSCHCEHEFLQSIDIAQDILSLIHYDVLLNDMKAMNSFLLAFNITFPSLNIPIPMDIKYRIINNNLVMRDIVVLII